MHTKLHIVCVTILAICAAAAAHAASLNTYYQFPGGGDGLLPYGGLVENGGLLYGTTGYGGATGRGTVFTVNPKTGAETLLYSFKGGTDGYFPQAGLTTVGKLLYGTTAYGGNGNSGTVFSIDPATGVETIIYSFTPATGTGTTTPLYYASGYLYGETYGGGADDQGTVFKVNVKTGVETTLYSFKGGSDGCNGSNGALVQVGSLLYGTTTSCGPFGAGVLFSIDPNTGAETVVDGFNFYAYGPAGGVIAVGPILYGTTQYGGLFDTGTVYSFDTTNGTEALVYSFTERADGGDPQAGLVYVAGNLYGTTYFGGAGYGTVFGINITTRAETTLHTFTGGNDGGYSYTPLIAVSGMLYGTSLGAQLPGGNAGSVFAVKIRSKAATTLHDFTGPNPVSQTNSGLLASGTLLYGTTGNAGSANAGTIYQLNPTTGVASTLYNFTGGEDGYEPTGGLTAAGGLLYGVAALGGTSGQGTIFAYNPATGTETTLHSFTFSDGANPNGPLLSYKNLLYGTTRFGGFEGAGTIFSIDPVSGVLTTLYSFGGNDGFEPQAGLIENSGILIGTSEFGGNDDAGNVFTFNLKTKVEATLYSFTGGADGDFPLSALIYGNGVVYGTTLNGGSCTPYSFGCGVVFGVNVKTGAEAVLHNFTGGNDGLFPSAPLTYVNKTLYGTASSDVALGLGSIFSIVPKSGTFTTLYSFTGSNDGFDPASPLLYQSGTLIGTTNFAGTQGGGTIFGLTP